MNQKVLSMGERLMIANALADVALQTQKNADVILEGAAFFNTESGEPYEGATNKQEALAAHIIARSKSLRRRALAMGNLADFIANPTHKITVDCLLLIPDQG